MPPREKTKPKVKANQKSKAKPKVKDNTITEEKMVKIQKAREQRSLDLFYKLSEPEADEETPEQKLQRKKKELKNNTFI